jgi:hypothetical protein
MVHSFNLSYLVLFHTWKIWANIVFFFSVFFSLLAILFCPIVSSPLLFYLFLLFSLSPLFSLFPSPLMSSPNTHQKVWCLCVNAMSPTFVVRQPCFVSIPPTIVSCRWASSIIRNQSGPHWTRHWFDINDGIQSQFGCPHDWWWLQWYPCQKGERTIQRQKNFERSARDRQFGTHSWNERSTHLNQWSRWVFFSPWYHLLVDGSLLQGHSILEPHSEPISTVYRDLLMATQKWGSLMSQDLILN